MLSLPAEQIGGIVGILTIGGILFGVIRMLYNFIKKIEKAIGEDKEGRSISDRLGRVEHQVFPNGGSSIADQVENVKKSVAAIEAKTETIEALLHIIIGQNTNAIVNNKKRFGGSPEEPSQTAKPRKRKTT